MKHINYTKFLVLGLSLIAFIGCHCETYGDGVVMDAETLEPISGVVVTSYVDKSVPSYVEEMTTSDSGLFSGTTGNGKGGFAGCQDLLMQFNKEGYTETQAYNPQGKTIYLTKIK